MKLSDLKPLEKNPFKSKGDKQIEAIGKSIDSFKKMMEIRKIVIDENNEILGGNKRYFALKGLGYKEIPEEWIDKRTDLTEEEKREFIIKDNAHWGSEWDFDLLNEWDIDLENNGIEVNFEDDICLSAEEEVQEVEADDPDKIKTEIKEGDIFQIGNHKLMCGDSTKEEDVSKLMDGNKADMVLTDPPYGLNTKGDNSKRGKETSLMKGGLKLKDFKDDTTEYATKSFNICQEKDIPVQVWFGANYYAHSVPETGNWLVWDKRVDEKMSNTNSDCELAWVKDGHNSVRIFRHLWNGLIKGSENKERRVHPTQKPIELFTWCFRKYNPDGKSVLDLFGGSGSTLIACEQTNRKCYMMELDPVYCQVIINRMRKLNPEIEIKCLNRNIKV